MAGLWTTAIVNSHLIKLMTNWGGAEQLLTSVIGEPFSHVSMMTSELGIKAESPAVKALSEQLSVILKGEAQRYWNMILGWAHKAQFYEAFEKEARRRGEAGLFEL
jgi:hypothetical protein